MERQTVIVAGWPKSGTTWLTRLLGDALDSPTGGSIASEDGKEVATEGQDRHGPYIVRKGHYRLLDDTRGPAIPGPHQLAWRQLTNEKVVFIMRDPRDVCVSGAFYWRQTVEQFLNRMIAGQVARLPRWDKYVDRWLQRRFPFVLTRYEALLEDTEAELNRILELAALDYDTAHIPDVVTRQSFSARKDDYQGKHLDQHLRIMREGKAGGWKSHFNQQMGHMCQAHFGATMARLGYVTDTEWWKELPE